MREVFTKSRSWFMEMYKIQAHAHRHAGVYQLTLKNLANARNLENPKHTNQPSNEPKTLNPINPQTLSPETLNPKTPQSYHPKSPDTKPTLNTSALSPPRMGYWAVESPESTPATGPF